MFYLHQSQYCTSSTAGFLMSIAGASILFGFGSMIALTKKKDPEMFAEVKFIAIYL